MTPKERVLAAASLAPSDKLPAGFKATDDIIERLGVHFGSARLIDILRELPVDTYGDFNNVRVGVYPEYAGSSKKHENTPSFSASADWPR